MSPAGQSNPLPFVASALAYAVDTRESGIQFIAVNTDSNRKHN